MYQIIILIFSGLISLSTQFGGQISDQPGSTENLPPQIMCLSDEIAQNGIPSEQALLPKILKSIKKATKSNTTEGYVIPECQGKGSCNTPEVADYQLVATNIKINHIIYPNNFDPNLTKSDRQLVKQLDVTSDPILADRYKNRIYRTFCGDWCYTCPPDKTICEDEERLNCVCTTDQAIEIPYNGSFHCDFIFYLQDTDAEGKPQLDEYGDLTPDHKNPADPDGQLPADNSLFAVYFRKGATLPDSIRCQKKSSLLFERLLSFLKPQSVFAQSSGLIRLIYPQGTNNSWLWERNPNEGDGFFKARNSQILTADLQKYPESGSNIITNPLSLKGNFEVFKNLFDPPSDNFIYLVEEGKVNEMLQGLNTASPAIKVFNYYLFSFLETTSGGQKSIKLGRFKPITSQSWINKWAEESKPAIYIYPPQKTQLSVKLHTKGKITISDPPYNPNTGWNIIVYPNGTISPISNSKSYPYLYYEANLTEVAINNTGKVVSTDELQPYLSNQLNKMGLSQKEIKDFNDYWIPRLESVHAAYFFIHFLESSQIDYLEPLETSIPVNTSIRIRVYFKPLDYPLSVPSQTFARSPERKGLTIVEWGGILDNQ
jgi:hypothetical protein